MPNPLVITAQDFAPLLRDGTAMQGAVDALEAAMLALYKGNIRQATATDETRVDDQPSTARVNLIGSDGAPTGLRVATSASGANSGFLVLLDGASRQLLALLDPAPFGATRVGAEGGLGARHLAPEGARNLAMLGSGRQARTQMAAVCAALPDLETVRVFSPTQEHREAFSKEMSTWLERDIQPAGSVEEAIREADVVDVVNTAPGPIFETGALKPGALVISITGRGQTPADFLTRARMVAPVWEILAGNALREPFFSAIKAGSYTRENDYAGDLGAIISGDAVARRSAADIVDFEATAVPVFDHAIGVWAYEWARANGAGKEISLFN